jgi:hypothetical protein
LLSSKVELAFSVLKTDFFQVDSDVSHAKIGINGFQRISEDVTMDADTKLDGPVPREGLFALFRHDFRNDSTT